MAPAQEEVDLGAASLQSRRSLEEATALYDEVEFARAIQVLDNLLAGFDAWSQGTLPEEDEEVRVEGLKLRGLAYSNLGQAESARADFAAVLRQRPDLKLDEKLLYLFNSRASQVVELGRRKAELGLKLYDPTR